MSLGTAGVTNPAPGSDVACPQPTELLALKEGASPSSQCPRTHWSRYDHRVPDSGHQFTYPHNTVSRPLGQAHTGSCELQAFVPICRK